MRRSRSGRSAWPVSRILCGGDRRQVAEAGPAEPPRAGVVIVMIPPLALIFLVLGTIFVGMATPTEGGAMGAIGSAHPGLRQSPPRLVAAASGDGLDGEAVLLRRLHPDRLDRVQPGLPRRQRRSVGGAPADRPARRPARLPHRRQPDGIRAGVLPRLFRARLHRHTAARAGRGEAGHRSHLVRRAARRQHADLVHASALRLRPVLSPQRGAVARADRSRHRQADRAGDHHARSIGAACRSC